MTIAREELDRIGLCIPAISCATSSWNRWTSASIGWPLDIKAPRPRLNEVVLGRRAVTVDTALRLARYFGTTPDFWINLQTRYDLDVAELKLRPRIDREVAPRAA